MFKSTTSFAKRRPSHIVTCEAVCDSFKSTTSFAKRRLSHTVTCKSVCETNSIVPLRNKRHLTYLCDAIRIAKVSQTVLCGSTETNLCRKKWRRGRILTNAALRLGMPPCPSLWVVGGTSFTRFAALRNFNGGSPTSSTTNWHSASFSSSAFRSRSNLPNSLAFLALANCFVISFSCLAAFSYTSDW